MSNHHINGKFNNYTLQYREYWSKKLSTNFLIVRENIFILCFSAIACMLLICQGTINNMACPGPLCRNLLWWCHQMETFSALLALCAGNSPCPGAFSSQRPVARGFDDFFDLHLNKPLSKQSRGWWFETPSRSLWPHHNAVVININFDNQISERTYIQTGIFMPMILRLRHLIVFCPGTGWLITLI